MTTLERIVLAFTNPNGKIEDDAFAVQIVDNVLTMTVAIVDPEKYLGPSYDATYKNAIQVQQQAFFAEAVARCKYDPCTKHGACRYDGRCTRDQCWYFHPKQYPEIPSCHYAHSDEGQKLRGTSNRVVLDTCQHAGFNLEKPVPCVTLTATVQLTPAPVTKTEKKKAKKSPSLRVLPDASITRQPFDCAELKLDKRLIEDDWATAQGPIAEALEVLLQVACRLAGLDRAFFSSPLPDWQQCTQVNFDQDAQEFKPAVREVWSKHRFVTETLVDWFNQCATEAAAPKTLFGTKYAIPKTLANDFGILPTTPLYAVCTSRVDSSIKLPLRFLLSQIPQASVAECCGVHDNVDEQFVTYTRFGFTHPLRDFACWYNLLAACVQKEDDPMSGSNEWFSHILRRRTQIRNALNMLCRHAKDEAWRAIKLPPGFHHQLDLLDASLPLVPADKVGRMMTEFRELQIYADPTTFRAVPKKGVKLAVHVAGGGYTTPRGTDGYAKRYDDSDDDDDWDDYASDEEY